LRGRGKLRVWPVYFDASLSRGEGRRVPRSKAVRDPKAEDVEKAARKLGLNPILEPAASYSKQPWRPVGVVLVDKKDRKTRIINDIAEEMKRR
jgi:signal recognition particle subunit SRP19